ncbi:hypothetical protein QWM81_15305 [Streptomyces ficellus]|uniref:Uncharacterized protein n=1 Tax=Streptomyces ficellus TaxID=1977088 RepID=A0ABT7Z7H9_9ACTN|nr:hypothetical protein [Streptomyces ficellus]MDN3295396.1 hypothetical protein [Streptomyces ficellus]
MRKTTIAAPIRTGRHSLRSVGVWLAMTVALVGAGTATATATTEAAHRKPTLVGTWETEVTIGTGSGAARTVSRFSFAADHTLTTDGAPGENGDPEYPGSGYWTAGPDGSFSFYITHDGPEEPSEGVYPGTVHAVHMGRLKGDKFITTAVAFTKNEKTGVQLGPVTVSSSATRVGPPGASPQGR